MTDDTMATRCIWFFSFHLELQQGKWVRKQQMIVLFEVTAFLKISAFVVVRQQCLFCVTFHDKLNLHLG